jgi:hypothetical protein
MGSIPGIIIGSLLTTRTSEEILQPLLAVGSNAREMDVDPASTDDSWEYRDNG